MLKEIVLKNLQHEGLLLDKRQVRLVLAYSGGHDSTVLLHLLTQLRETENIYITAAYCDHGWRGTPAPELPLLHEVTQSLQVPLILIPSPKEMPKTEAAAREWRYRQLTQLARDLKADAVLTAHHADDQVETLLFRLFRGTGVDGLQGIQRRLVLEPAHGADTPVLRPLLDVYRQAMHEYAQTLALKSYDDPTNANTQFQRNALRQEVLPFLEKSYPQLKNTLLRLSQVVEGDMNIIADKVAPLWEEVVREGVLDVTRFNQLARPYQRRIVRKYLASIAMEYDFHKIEEVVSFIEGKKRRKLGSSLMSLDSCANGDTRFLAIYKNKLTVVSGPAKKVESKTPPKPADITGIAVSVPGENIVEEFQFVLRAIELSDEERAKPGLLRPQTANEIYVDLSQYRNKKLLLRTRQPGDKIQPFGMTHPMRFKNFLINRGVPRFNRDALPLLACGADVLWAVGVGVSETLRVMDKPTHVLKIEPISSLVKTAAEVSASDLIIPADSISSTEIAINSETGSTNSPSTEELDG